MSSDTSYSRIKQRTSYNPVSEPYDVLTQRKFYRRHVGTNLQYIWKIWHSLRYHHHGKAYYSIITVGITNSKSIHRNTSREDASTWQTRSLSDRHCRTVISCHRHCIRISRSTCAYGII